jgi:hypothetical protein
MGGKVKEMYRVTVGAYTVVIEGEGCEWRGYVSLHGHLQHVTRVWGAAKAAREESQVWIERQNDRGVREWKAASQPVMN